MKSELLEDFKLVAVLDISTRCVKLIDSLNTFRLTFFKKKLLKFFKNCEEDKENI